MEEMQHHEIEQTSGGGTRQDDERSIREFLERFARERQSYPIPIPRLGLD